MTELLNAAQMRAIEQAAIDSGEVTGLELMERAGAGVVAAIFEEWPELEEGDRHAVVLCGPGNNGGDGFVVARLLKERGWTVEVFLLGDPAILPPDAKANCLRWQDEREITPWSVNAVSTSTADIFVDAVFGAGLVREPAAEILDPFSKLYASGATSGRMVSVDAPTGLCMDSGRALNTEYGAVHASLTVTFHKKRPGHFLNEGAFYCGKVAVKDIGLDGGRNKSSGATLRLAEPPSRGHTKAPFSHKYAHGHALILSGGAGKGGAARLSARGAIRIGAGLVTVGCPPAALQENAARLDAIMLKSIKGAGGLTEILTDTRINALCLGPGLGLDHKAEDLVAAALAIPTEELASVCEERSRIKSGMAPRGLVLDADALTILAKNQPLFAALHDRCVLTPHAGEFARLFPDIAEKLNAPATTGSAYSKVDATREAAARAGCVVLFKGPDTVIATPDGRALINSAHYDRAAPWLATAGSGDVLAGFVTGLLARGFDPMQAGETATWLHVECALKYGPGLIAEDLPEQIPAVFRDLGN